VIKKKEKIRREFQEIEKFRRKTCCPQKGRGKKRGKKLRGVESLSKRESKKGKEIRDPRKNEGIFRRELSIGSEVRSITETSGEPDIFDANGPF